jgi:hypothetical protein
MAADVVPVLNEKIQTSFQSNMMRDRRIAQISKRIRDGTATFVDGHDYAERLGESLSKALISNLNEENLPDGRLYYNIAKRTVTPALQNNYELTNEAAEQIQSTIDSRLGIGLKSIKADFPESRIKGLIDKMTTEGISLEDALIWLGEPIINNSEAFFDDFIDSNAKFRTEAGLKATITRIAEANCCPWCDSLAGTYEYGSAPDDIYRRHQYCRCTVTYQTGKKSQNVWSKSQWESSPEEIDRRKTIGQKSTISAAERIEQAAQLLRDEVISDFQKETGYSRRSAGIITRNKNPAEVLKEVEKIKERQRALRR